MDSNNLSNVTAILLAGGQGTRIRGLYPDVPKPMIEVGGQPFLYWPTAFFARFGVRRFIYSTGFKGEQISTWCEDGSMPELERLTCRESKPLGTGGGLLNCLDECGEWIAVANGDSLCLDGVMELLVLTGKEGLAGGIIGVHSEDTSRFGSLEINDQGRLMSFREKEPGHGYINAGIYLFRKEALLRLDMEAPCSIELDLIPKLLQAGGWMQTVLVRDAPFIDIGTPEAVSHADAFIRTNDACFDWTI